MEQGEEVRLKKCRRGSTGFVQPHCLCLYVWTKQRKQLSSETVTWITLGGNSHCMLRSCSTHVTWWIVLVVICLRRFYFATPVAASYNCRSVGMKVFGLLSSCTSCLFMSVHLRTGFWKIHIYLDGLQPAVVFTYICFCGILLGNIVIVLGSLVALI